MVAVHSGRTVTPGRASIGAHTSPVPPPQPGLRVWRRLCPTWSRTRPIQEGYHSTMSESARSARSSKLKPLPPRKYLTRKSSRPLLVGLHQVPSRTSVGGVRTTYSCHQELLCLSRPLKHHVQSSATTTIQSTRPTVPSTQSNPTRVPMVATNAPTIPLIL